MELNLENLVNEIIKKEADYYSCMLDAQSTYGEDPNNFILEYWRAKWSVLYVMAVKFNFVDKLIR